MSRRSKRIKKALEAAQTANPGEPRWYAVKVLDGREWTVKSAMRRLNIECWYPWFAEDRLSAALRVIGSKVSPHLPGYVFVRLMAWQGVGGIRRMDGVVDFVRFDEEAPCRVPDEVIDIIHKTFADFTDRPFEREAQESARFHVGDIHPVVDGVWSRFDAEITALAKNGKISVWLNLFGRVVAAQLPVQHLGPVKRRSIDAPQRAA